MKKPILKCHRCGNPYHFERPGGLLKDLLFFLPIRRFFCAHCLKDTYVLITDEKYKQYEPI